MKKTETVAWLGTDGPRAALRKMKKNKISSIFVLRKDRSLAGVISAEEAVKLVQDGARTLDGALQEDIVTVQPDTPAADLFQVMHDLPYPLAVVDEKKRLKGVIVRGLLLGAVAERGAA
jgi:glycine betaine/proline transport system ATP-binding protein